jgi:aminobenzoyl-glutamate utilization protein B
MTVVDLLTRPDVLAQAREYFDKVQTKDRKYTPLIRPQDQPAIHLNKGIMDRYRPEMRKFYYDPAKYPTYLDQLGIKYPTVRGATTTQQQR